MTSQLLTSLLFLGHGVGDLHHVTHTVLHVLDVLAVLVELHLATDTNRLGHQMTVQPHSHSTLSIVFYMSRTRNVEVVVVFRKLSYKTYVSVASSL